MDERTYNIHIQKNKRNEHTCLYLFCLTSENTHSKFCLIMAAKKEKYFEERQKDKENRETNRWILFRRNNSGNMIE